MKQHIAPLLGLAVLAYAQDETTLEPELTKPDSAPVVPKNFVGFGFEPAFFNAYGNTFSENLVTSLARRMRDPPIIRVGGTSGDTFTFDLDQEADSVCVSEACDSHLSEYSLGPSWFDVYDRFQDAQMSIQAPLQNPNDVDNALDIVWQAYDRLGKDRVAAIAIGNEVEFIYEDVDAYSRAALALEDAIVRNLSLTGDDERIFEYGNTASGTVQRNSLYRVQDLVSTNLLDSGRALAMAEHLYQLGDDADWTDETMQELMINHGAISDRLNLYQESIDAARANDLDYAITENAAVLGGAPEQFSGGFGYALWAVDFNLEAMSRGVSRVSNLAGRPSARRVFWVPDDSGAPVNPGPQVRAPFAAAIFVADFVGKDADTAVANIPTADDRLSAYAMYNDESGEMERVALVNMYLYNGTEVGERGNKTFRVPVAEGIGSVQIRSLHADLGVAAMGFDYAGPLGNVTFGGEQWTYKVDQGEGHFPAGTVESAVDARDGFVTVTVPDSEAAILYMRNEDGSDVGDDDSAGHQARASSWLLYGASLLAARRIAA